MSMVEECRLHSQDTKKNNNNEIKEEEEEDC